MKVVRALLSHLTVILSLAMLILLIFDYFNPYMEFLSNVAAKIFLLVLCVSCFALVMLTRFSKE